MRQLGDGLLILGLFLSIFVWGYVWMDIVKESKPNFTLIVFSTLWSLAWITEVFRYYQYSKKYSYLLCLVIPVFLFGCYFFL